MVFKTTSTTNQRRSRQAAVTLVEYMFAVALSSIAALIVVSLIIYTSKSFSLMASYYALGQKSGNALDVLGRDVRQSYGLKSYTNNLLTLNAGTNTSDIVYAYSPTNRTLTRTQGSDSKVLLKDCSSLQFSLYQRNPVAGTYDQYPAATATNCKVMSVQWTCSSSIYGTVLTTEAEQEAKIVIRKF
jgi:Tfp pilus assembly protein PilW